MAQRVQIGDMADAIMEEMEKYATVATDTLKDAVKDSAKTVKKEIFIPMEDNGYYGWKILLNDEIMKTLVGGLELPDSK